MPKLFNPMVLRRQGCDLDKKLFEKHIFGVIMIIKSNIFHLRKEN